jgi:hypothetical protein
MITRLDRENRVYNITEGNGESLYVLSLHKEGLVRLVTVDSEGNYYVYVLTEGHLLKIREFENGTKEI